MKKLISIIVLLVIIFGSTLCAAETKFGIGWSYGKDYILPESWTSEECDNTVNRFTFMAETNEFIPTWESVYFGAELRYSMHKADETKKGSFGLGHDAGFREQGINFTVRKEWGWFYVGWFAGISYVHEFDSGMHQLKEDTHLLGTWGPIVGLNIPISGPWELRLESRLGHTSGPFAEDRGKNWGELAAAITCSFDKLFRR